MIVALLVISDGRDEYRQLTLDSAAEMLPQPDHLVEVDDRDHTLGFDGAIRAGWDQILDTDATHVFHLEADYTFHRPVLLAQMGEVLDRHPYLTQLALRRQPWNDIEAAAGTVVPDYAIEHEMGASRWLEHTRNFTTNPSLYPRWLLEYGWPEGPHSEGRFSGYLRKLRPDLRFAYWGGRDDGEAVHHIGVHRAGRNY